MSASKLLAPVWNTSSRGRSCCSCSFVGLDELWPAIIDGDSEVVAFKCHLAFFVMYGFGFFGGEFPFRQGFFFIEYSSVMMVVLWLYNLRDEEEEC